MFQEWYAALGIVLLVAAFLLNASKRIKRFTYTYNLLNLLGAGLLTAYALQINAVVFAALEGIWTFFAAYFLLRRVFSREPVLTVWEEHPPALRSVTAPKPKKKRRILGKKKEGEGETAPMWPWSTQ